MRVAYYVTYDPDNRISETPLTIYELRGWQYVETDDLWFPSIGLGLTVWDGEFEGRSVNWLRWIDGDGNLIPTGRELAEDERLRADAEQNRADAERLRVDVERERAERLTAQLRAAGIEPE